MVVEGGARASILYGPASTISYFVKNQLSSNEPKGVWHVRVCYVCVHELSCSMPC